MKIISAGVVVYFNHTLLACVPFGKKNGFDIPKGQVEENEFIVEAAIRELYEETGIRTIKSKLKDLGKFSYMPTKDLYLFSLELNFNTIHMKCISTFDFHGKQVPEVVGYKSIDFSDIHYYYKSLQPILKTIIERGDLYDNYL